MSAFIGRADELAVLDQVGRAAAAGEVAAAIVVGEPGSGKSRLLAEAEGRSALTQRFRVIGAGAVYVVDGMRESYTNVSEEQPGDVLSIFNLRLHILSHDDGFDLERRRPSAATRTPAGSKP